MTGADFKSSANDTACGRFAASSVKSGALSPTCNVELSLGMRRL